MTVILAAPIQSECQTVWTQIRRNKIVETFLFGRYVGANP